MTTPNDFQDSALTQLDELYEILRGDSQARAEFSAQLDFALSDADPVDQAIAQAGPVQK